MENENNIIGHDLNAEVAYAAWSAGKKRLDWRGLQAAKRGFSIGYYLALAHHYKTEATWVEKNICLYAEDIGPLLERSQHYQKLAEACEESGMQ